MTKYHRARCEAARDGRNPDEIPAPEAPCNIPASDDDDLPI